MGQAGVFYGQLALPHAPYARPISHLFRKGVEMIDPIEFEEEGIKVVIHPSFMGWEYEFDYKGVHYFAGYRWSALACEEAGKKIRELKLLEEVEAG